MSDLDPRLSQLYRETASEGPAPALDAAILAAARQRLAIPARRARPWWARWMVPASLTATLVLSVSMFLLVTREQPAIVQGEIARELPSREDSSSPGATPPSKAKTAAGPAAGAVTATHAPAAVDAFPAERRAKADEGKAMRESSTVRDTAGPGAAVPAAVPAAALRQLQATKPAPESWLNDIRRLKREGREKEAAEQLAEFRRAYPDVVVPADVSQ